MSLASNLLSLATRVGTEAKALRTLINGNAANLAALNTTDKTNLVAAINETLAASGGTVDPDIADIGALTPANDDFIQRKASHWVNRTIAQVKADLNINNVDNTSDVNKPVSTAQAAINAVKADLVAGVVPIAQLPAAVLGGVSYQGGWNATTNSPTIPAAASTNKGWYYKVTTAGTTSIGGLTDWQLGDWIISNGSAWEKVDQSESVTSVAGRVGAVTLTKTDVGLANVDNTSDVNKPVSTAATAAFAPIAHVGAGGTAHANVVAAGAAGFMTGADKAILDDLGSTTTDFVAAFNTALV